MTEFVSVKEFMEKAQSHISLLPAVGSKPCIVLNGEAWKTEEKYKTIANMFVGKFEHVPHPSSPQISSVVPLWRRLTYKVSTT